jgi:hypothetical protein
MVRNIMPPPTMGDQVIKYRSPQPHSEMYTSTPSVAANSQISNGSSFQRSRKLQSVLIRMSRGGNEGDQSIEETRELHVYDQNEYHVETRDDDMNDEATISTLGDHTAGREQENVREEIRDQFFHSPAYEQRQPSQPPLPLLENNNYHQHMEITAQPTYTRRRLSRSLSPKKRSHRRARDSNSQPRPHSSSPRRQMRSASKSPRHKTVRKVVERFFSDSDESNPPLTQAVRKPNVEASIMNKEANTLAETADFRKHDVDSESSDEALEFTKERYKRRKSRAANRPDTSPISRPKQDKTHSPRRPTISPKTATPPKTNRISKDKEHRDMKNEEKKRSTMESYDSTSSDYQSSTTGASFTEAEKLRLKRQLKSRAILKEKAAKAAARTKDNDPMYGFIDKSLADAASTFVHNLVGQLGLDQPFGDEDLTDEYNLLRWDYEDTPKNKTNSSTPPFFNILSWGKTDTKNEESSRMETSDEETERTHKMKRLGESSSEDSGVNKKSAARTGSGKNQSSSKRDDSKFTQTVVGSGPAVIDQKEISAVARAMAKPDDNTVTSDEEDSDAAEKPFAQPTDIEGTKQMPSRDLNEGAKAEDNEKLEDLNLAVSSDSEEKLQRQMLEENEKGDDDVNSLTYSLEDSNKAQKVFRVPSKKLSEDSSVAKLVNKFEYELEMRSPTSSSVGAVRPTKNQSKAAVRPTKNQSKAASKDLAIVLSLSGEDSLVPTEEITETSKQSVKETPRAKHAGLHGVTHTPVFSDSHQQELKAKIDESYKRRKGHSHTKLTARYEESAHTVISTESRDETTSEAPAFVPAAMPSSRATKATVTEASHPLQQSQSQREQASEKLNLRAAFDNLSASLIGQASLGDASFATALSPSPMPLDIDNMVAKIDGVVQRLIMTGKLPGPDDDDQVSDLQQRTLRKNTAELLRNLALLKSRHATQHVNKDPVSQTTPHSHVPKTVQYDRRRTLAPISVALPPPSPPTPPPAPAHSDTHSRGTEPLSNMARIRARRDEAAMRIKERTQRLAGLSSKEQSSQQSLQYHHSGPIPVPITSTNKDHLAMNHVQPLNHHMDRSTIPRPKGGPPRPEDLSGHVRKPIINTVIPPPQSPMVHKERLSMSKSDIEFCEWEKKAGLEAVLALSRSEEQGMMRPNESHNFMLLHPSRNEPSSLMHAHATTSIIDSEYYDDVNDDDDDGTDFTIETTDSSGGSYGSESDSERLRRISSMLNELRRRRQQRR